MEHHGHDHDDRDPRVRCRRVLLVGMMAAGKTTVGWRLAATWGWPYLDNDELVERAAGAPTAEVLGRGGEAALRAAEAAALAEALSADPPLVAGVAAGVATDPDTCRQLRDSAFVAYLRAPVPVLAGRAAAGDGRPWLRGADAVTELGRLARGRDEVYRAAADVVVDVEGLDPDEVARRIAAAHARCCPAPEEAP